MESLTVDWLRPIIWLTVLLILIDGVQAEATERPLVVTNCRVGLIRKASLAGARLGILSDVCVTEGDAVEAGQVIATLRDETARQVLAIATKEVSNTVDLRLQKKISELATVEYSKAFELNRSVPGGFSEIELKKLRLAAEKSVLQIEHADFQLQMAGLRRKEAEATLETYRITAPFSGVVLQVNKQPGEALAAGEAVMEIANFDRMRVEGFIPVESGNRIQRGAAVTVEVPGSEPNKVHRFEGRVKHIAPIIHEVSQKIRVWAEIENRGLLLKDGLPATMTISVSKSQSDEIASDQNRD